MQQLSTRLLPLRLRLTRRTPVRHLAAVSPVAAPSTAPRWGRLAGVTLGVTALGLVAGAVIAAPDQLVPLLRWIGREVATFAGPMLERGLDGVGAVGAQLLAFLSAERTPRELAMLVLGISALTLAAAAAVISWRSSRSGVGSIRGVPAGSATSFVTETSSAARMATPRRAFTRTTPTEVRALVERGSSLTDIARRTGMPLDAVRTLLAVADPSGQLPVRVG